VTQLLRALPPEGDERPYSVPLLVSRQHLHAVHGRPPNQCTTVLVWAPSE
jgi:hypothetical protein